MSNTVNRQLQNFNRQQLEDTARRAGIANVNQKNMKALVAELQSRSVGLVSREGVNANGTPRNGNGAPRNGNGAPRNANGAPRNANGTPRSGNGAPRNANGAPRNANGTPRSGNGAPRNANSGNGAPRNANGTPRSGNGAPRNANGTSRNGNGAPRLKSNANGASSANTSKVSSPPREELLRRAAASKSVYWLARHGETVDPRFGFTVPSGVAVVVLGRPGHPYNMRDIESVLEKDEHVFKYTRNLITQKMDMKGIEGKGILRWPYRVRAKTYVEGDTVPVAILSTADPTRGYGLFKVPLPRGFGREDDVAYRAAFDMGSESFDLFPTLHLADVTDFLKGDRRSDTKVLFVSCCHAAAPTEAYHSNIGNLQYELDFNPAYELPSKKLRPGSDRLQHMQGAIDADDMYYLGMHGVTMDTQFTVPSGIVIVFLAHPGKLRYGASAEKLLEDDAYVRYYTARLIMQSMDLKHVNVPDEVFPHGSYRVYSRTYVPGEVLQDIYMEDEPDRGFGLFKVPLLKHWVYLPNDSKKSHAQQLDLRPSLSLGSSFFLSTAARAISALPVPPGTFKYRRVLFVTSCRGGNPSSCALAQAQNMQELKGLRHIGNGHWPSNDNDPLKTTLVYGDFIRQQLWLMKDALPGRHLGPIRVNFRLAVNQLRVFVRRRWQKSRRIPDKVKGALKDMLQAIKQRIGKRGGPELTRELTDSLKELQEMSQ